MVLTLAFAALAILSLALLAWQVLAAARFPIHRRAGALPTDPPPVLILKPLKGCDEHTTECLRSWFTQKYTGRVRLRFGVAEESDPVCGVVRSLIAEFPERDAALVITRESLGANAKISNLAQLLAQAGTDFIDSTALVCISDADVRAPEDLLASVVAQMNDANVGLVNCFYRVANPHTRAMQVEAVAINADFWSQVLQSNMLKPQDFSLGAVMLVRSKHLEKIGGFTPFVDYLADDYQLGNRVAKLGVRIALSPLVVECLDPAQSWRDVWIHQLRWGRTIRVSQPLPYFFSILNNVTLWVSAFAISAASLGVYRIAPGYPWHIDLLWIGCCAGVWLVGMTSRLAATRYLAARLMGSRPRWITFSIPLLKDLMQSCVWAASFAGTDVVWRGRRFHLLRGGKLMEAK